MEHLTGINIRSGLEDLDLTVKEIFKVRTEPFGDQRIKELFIEGTTVTFKKYPDFEALIDKEDYMQFEEARIPHKLNNTLTAYVYDYYGTYRNLTKSRKITCEKGMKIEFVNDAKLTFDQFCQNLMLAQAFTGRYDKPEIPYSFIGLGNFSPHEYADIHQLAIFANIHMLFFFIYYQNILSSIEDLITAAYEDDIRTQKKYLTDKEYKSLMRALKAHKKIISSQIKNENFSNDDIPDDSSDYF